MQYGIKGLPDTSTGDQLEETNPRTSDLKFNAVSTRPHAPKHIKCSVAFLWHPHQVLVILKYAAHMKIVKPYSFKCNAYCRCILMSLGQHKAVEIITMQYTRTTVVISIILQTQQTAYS